MEKLRGFWAFVRRSVSPVFMVLLVASIILWYISKLNYTYTTDQLVRLDIDGIPAEVTCVVEGKGTNLVGYRVYVSKRLHLELADLKFTRSTEEGHEDKLILDEESLRNAISLKLSDIKVMSIRNVPEIDDPSTFSK